MRKHGRDIEAVEAWVRKGLAEGWCKPGHADRNNSAADPPWTGFRRHFVADLTMGCEDPKIVEVWGRYTRTAKHGRFIVVDVITRCRKCQPCLDAKSRFWTGRAMDEYAAAHRTWLLTLTVSPEKHYFYDARMQQPLYRGNTLVREAVGPLHGLAKATLFRLRAREIGYDITDYLKRVRKARGSFRYLLVAERHMKDPNSEVFGKPHFHVLLHETEGSPLVLPSEWQPDKGFCEADCKYKGRPFLHKENGEVHDHALIRKQWKQGFPKAVLCGDMRSAVYVCKYVSKDPMARVRASIGYGKITQGIDDA